jgi:hypothetical protein
MGLPAMSSKRSARALLTELVPSAVSATAHVSDLRISVSHGCSRELLTDFAQALAI